MDTSLVAAIEYECAQLVAKFALYVDQRRYAEVIALFADDGEFTRPGLSAKGSAALSAWLESRPANWVTRHVCGPTVFESVDDSEANAVTYITVFQGEDAGKPMLPIEPPVALVEYHDCFRKTDRGWRIALRTVKPIMAKGA